jgi:hypothetical protein
MGVAPPAPVASLRSTSMFVRLLAALSLAVFTFAAEQDALAISQNIRARHMPFSTILDPIFEAPDSNVIAAYSRCGDSAIWTGHYIAAEAYRYKVTGDPNALDNLRAALWGLRLLVEVPGTGVLARCVVPVDSPYAPGIVAEENSNGIYSGTYDNTQYYWAGNTSRDQYSGVFFGMAVAWDLVDEIHVRGDVGYLMDRLLSTLDKNGWNVEMPDGSVSTTFLLRPDQQLALLQIGRHINPNWFSSKYKTNAAFKFFTVPLPIGIEVLDVNSSYFKFNLDTINLFSLIRWEDSDVRRGPYEKAYDTLRKTTNDQQNAHFNMIDRALNGPDARRDAETVQLLREWLLRPRRDVHVDLRGVVEACGDNRACQPVPVPQRVTTDFLWQRSPFQMYGGGDGFIEGAGIDYILPYWMGRYYGVVNE